LPDLLASAGVLVAGADVSPRIARAQSRADFRACVAALGHLVAAQGRLPDAMLEPALFEWFSRAPALAVMDSERFADEARWLAVQGWDRTPERPTAREIVALGQAIAPAYATDAPAGLNRRQGLGPPEAVVLAMGRLDPTADDDQLDCVFAVMSVRARQASEGASAAHWNALYFEERLAAIRGRAVRYPGGLPAEVLRRTTLRLERAAATDSARRPGNTLGVESEPPTVRKRR
jgi:hypothetical protein